MSSEHTTQNMSSYVGDVEQQQSQLHQLPQPDLQQQSALKSYWACCKDFFKMIGYALLCVMTKIGYGLLCVIKSCWYCWKGFMKVIIYIMLFCLIWGAVLTVFKYIIAFFSHWWLHILMLIVFWVPLFCLAFTIILLICFVVARIFQYIRWGHDYEKLVQFKKNVRGMLCLRFPLTVLLGSWLFSPIAEYVQPFNQVMLFQLPLGKGLLPSINSMCLLCMISSALYGYTNDNIFTVFLGRRHSLRAGQAYSEIIDVLLILITAHEFREVIPSFKHPEILGLSTLKWIKVTVLVIIAYNLITVFTLLTVWSFDKVVGLATNSPRWKKIIKKYLCPKYLLYYANGIADSIIFVMSSPLLLLTWVFYFGSHLDWKPGYAAKIWEYGKWSFVSLFILSFLWFIKTWVLLSWKAHTVYHRLENQISSTCQQLYFLNILSRKYDCQQNNDLIDESVNQSSSPISGGEGGLINRAKNKAADYCERLLGKDDETHDAGKTPTEMRDILRRDLLLQKLPEPSDSSLPAKKKSLPLAKIELATQHFTPAKQDLLKESYVFDILDKFKTTVDNRNILKEIIIAQEGSVAVKELDFFVKNLLNIEDQEQEIPFSKIQKWVERAHHRCINMLDTLSSAKEVTDCLNKIISSFLIGVIFIMWLLLTGLATNNVVVLIASPLLAASFIFGSTCKTLFEGILFVFVIHPFDVGDLCFIDDKMMEVKSISVWTTTFSMVDKFGEAQELVLYSNKELAEKTITNYKTKYDWSDHAEFNLRPMKKSKVVNQDSLISYVRKHLNEENCAFLSRSPNLTALVMEDSIKLCIRLEYKAEIDKERTYFECLQLKEKLRGDFYVIMRDVISKLETNYGGKEESQLGNKDSSLDAKIGEKEEPELETIVEILNGEKEELQLDK